MNSNMLNKLLLKDIVFIFILLAAFIFCFFPVWQGLIHAWASSDEYSHGFFIIPLCFYIVWLKKEALAQVPVKSSLLGFGMIIFALLLYVFAYHAEIMTLSSFSMVFLTAGAIAYFYGFLMLKKLIFPLFLQLFMIPVPAQIYSKLTIPLQLFVSEISVWLSSIFEIPIYRDGNLIYLPDQTFQVVQACSGLRSMVALLTLCVVFGYFTLRSNFLRTILFITGVPVAILVNIIRVLIMILFFYYFNIDLTSDSVHTVFGLVIFGLALILIYFIRGSLSIWDRSDTKK